MELEVTTPERVNLSLPIAGIGYRALAYLVDAGALLGVAAVLFFGYSFLTHSILEVYEGLSSTARVVGLIAIFSMIFGYWTVVETVWRGQTPGKKLLGIRVVRLDGSPVGLFESAVRNLLRLVDFMPVCYPVGITCMLIDTKHRRLGDLLAGTVLIREEKIDLARYAQAAGSLSTAELEFVSALLERYPQLTAEKRRSIAGQWLTQHGRVPAVGDEALRAQLTALMRGE